MKTTVYFHDAMIGHDPGPGHPERPERLRGLREHLAGAAPSGVVWREPPRVRRESLAWVHSPHYIEGPPIDARQPTLDELIGLQPTPGDGGRRERI